MGKRLSESVSRAGLALALFAACLAVAGCAQRDSNADARRPGGFYGGVSGGMAGP